MVKQTLCILGLASVISGCTSVDIKPLSADLGVVHICIEHNRAVKVAGFENIISDAIQKHGITTEVYAGSKPSHCVNYLTYTARRSWDMAAYLSHAELRLYDTNKLVAHADYHLVGKGGLSLTKWASAQSKMEPVVDELLAEYH